MNYFLRVPVSPYADNGLKSQSEGSPLSASSHGYSEVSAAIDEFVFFCSEPFYRGSICWSVDVGDAGVVKNRGSENPLNRMSSSSRTEFIANSSEDCG